MKTIVNMAIILSFCMIGLSIGTGLAWASCAADECDEVSCVWVDEDDCIRALNNATDQTPVVQAVTLRSPTPLGGTATAHATETFVWQACDQCSKTCPATANDQEGTGCSNCTTIFLPRARKFCAIAGCGVDGSWNEGNNGMGLGCVD